MYLCHVSSPPPHPTPVFQKLRREVSTVPYSPSHKPVKRAKLSLLNLLQQRTPSCQSLSNVSKKSIMFWDLGLDVLRTSF
jgi:hypothetical protein